MGWKRGNEANFPVVPHLVEREPMWDGNYNGCQLINCFIDVEREPMWDGNQSSELPDGVNDKLSENQCGVETISIGRRFLEIGNVEREPMWDGNCLTLIS